MHPRTLASMLLLGAFIAATALYETGCSTTQKAASEVTQLVQQSEQFAQSPSGRLVLNAVVDGVNAYVAQSGGTKSRANAANLATAVRSLESGQIPSIATVANAISTYTGSNSDASAVISAVVAGAASAPKPAAGMEAVAAKLDAISALTPPKPVAALRREPPRFRTGVANPDDAIDLTDAWPLDEVDMLPALTWV